MAALLLSSAGAAVGGSLFGPVGAIAGRLVGAVGGNLLDRSLLGGGHETISRTREGPRVSDLDVMASTEGSPIPRAYGRVRLAGEVIWATQLEEVIETRTETSESGGGGKGGGGGGGTTTTSTTITTYSYFGNFAVGLCEGPIGQIGRVWADGKPLDLAGLSVRFYLGSEDQTADPLIVAKQGGGTPAYRGTAYVVFERMPLAPFGNRIPQLQFEVVRPVDRLERMVRAVTLIPGTTEFGYEPGTVVQVMGPGRTAPENRHVGEAASDVVASLDALQAACPNLEHVAVVVAWFGTDLRAGTCVLKPGVDSPTKETFGAMWSVAGLDRASAHVVSQIGGRAAYGGTPSDQSVRNLIAELNARGLKVTLYPFVVMDVAPGNALPDPWSGAASQPAYPWRGRISCHPALGVSGSPDGTGAAASQVDAFFGSGSGGDWRYRRMILHYAALAADAGGVDAFLIGSELRGLTRVRSGAGVYPAVTQLVSLAAAVRAIVGPATKLAYAADWTEYGAHVVDAGATEVRFPLDPLWASSAIDAIGIDYYAPLSDWRSAAAHLDRAQADSIYDLDYLTANLRGGEGHDWFYANVAARAAQTRTPITDGLGKPWIYRQKDLWSFWTNAHRERVGGAELTSPTAWVPQSKPIWFTEVGCPAVDKGANQPNVFPDPKSSSSGVPHFSNGGRDDLIQRRYLESVLGAFDPAHGATLTQNPVSGVTGQRMLDPARVYLWTWDARPYPAFPAAIEVWSDGPNWDTGHWLTGRLGQCPMNGLISTMLADSGVENFDASALGEGPQGYLIDRPMSPRAAIEPLASAYAFEASERAGVLTFRPRGEPPLVELDEDDLVLPADDAPFRILRAQETELPREVSLGFSDGGSDFRRAIVSSRRLVAGGSRVTHADLAVVTDDASAGRRVEIWLQDLWAGRERVEFALPPSAMALTPGDTIALTIEGRRRLLEISEIVDTGQRSIKTRVIDHEVFDRILDPPQRRAPAPPPVIGPVHALVLDLPGQDNEEPPVLTRVAVFADPWPGPIAVWRSFNGDSFGRAGLAAAPSIIGETLDPLPRRSASRWDRGTRLRVRLFGGRLASASEDMVRAGANLAAIRNGAGDWEVIQYAQAELVGENTYELSTLLRGQGGSEWAMGDPTPAGAAFVRLDAHLVPVARGIDLVGRPMQLRIVAAARDHADPAAVAIDVTPKPLVFQPLSPVCVRVRRVSAGIEIDWVRRTRRNGDSWGPGDIPLGEEREAYAVDVMAGADVRRTLTTEVTHVLYAAADEISDFGSAQTSLSLRLAQVSAIAGRGIPTDVTLIP